MVEELAEEQILEVIRKQVKLSTAVVASGENISLNHNFLRPPDNLKLPFALSSPNIAIQLTWIFRVNYYNNQRGSDSRGGGRGGYRNDRGGRSGQDRGTSTSNRGGSRGGGSAPYLDENDSKQLSHRSNPPADVARER